MPIRFVTFDCAQTLVEVDYSLSPFTGHCARAVGLTPTPEQLARFTQRHVETIDAYWDVNAEKSIDACNGYWLDLTREWLMSEGFDPVLAEPMRRACFDLGFKVPSVLFRVFDDVIPCLERLRAAKLSLAVISNWDYSLFRVLEMFDLDRYFDVVVASRWEGVEKPDPRLFEIAFDRLGAKPNQVMHIGDDLVDDVEGAGNAGARAVLLDRSANPRSGSIQTLHELQWTD